MIVKKVELSNFRNYKLLKLDLDEKSECSATLFIDDNVLKHYDSVLEEMTIYPKAHVQQGIESIFK